MTFSTSTNILTESAGTIMTRTDGKFGVDADSVYIDGRTKIMLGNPILDDTIHKAVLGDALVTQLSKMFQLMKEMCYITSKAIENRSLPGGSLTTMREVVDSIDSEISTVADLILSDKVYLKK